MIQLAEWQWLVFALAAITGAFVIRSAFFVSVSLAATVVGGVIWYDPTVPVLFQLMMFGMLILVGVAVSQYVVKPPSEAELAAESAESEEQAADPVELIGRVCAVSTDIINGFGEVLIDDKAWRVRGEDAVRGEQVEIIGIDGVDRALLIVEKAE